MTQTTTAPSTTGHPATTGQVVLANDGDRITWTAPDGRTTITVQRTRFTYTVETRQSGQRVEENCGTYTTEYEARAVARGYAQMYRAESGGAPLRLTPPTKGTATTMSDPEAEVIRYAVQYTGGRINRGHGLGRSDVLSLQAMARRGFVTLTGARYRPDGAVVTDLGARTALGITTTTIAA